MTYSVYARPRPIRTALVLDATVFREGTWVCDALLDGIVADAIATWGGRQNPIILIEPDKDLSPDEWKELEAADPDRVQAFAPLSNAWVQRFHHRLSPWKISVETVTDQSEPKEELPEARWRWLHVEVPGIATPPVAENLKKLSRAKLLMIEFSADCPLEIRRFFHRNFGTFYQWNEHQSATVRRIAWLEGILPGIEVETVRISDVASAGAALTLFAGSLFPPKPRVPLRFIAPTEVSAVHLDLGHIRDPYRHIYRVFVGDSLHDFTAYWNELRMCGCWAAPHRHALWLPLSLTHEAAFMEALRSLLYDYSGQHSSGSRSIEITSETLSEDELKAVGSSLPTGNGWFPTLAVNRATRWARLRERLHDELEERRPHARLSSTNAERLRLSERIETLSVSEPKVLIGDGAWAVDVQIDFGASNRFKSPRWWCLPRRVGSALAQKIFRGSARVSHAHLFAVEVERRSARFGNQRTPETHIALPEETDVVACLVLPRRYGFDYDDTRKKQLEEAHPLSHLRISDKGQNLRGLIEIFGGFWAAEEFCERRFWREALAKLAGQDARRRDVLSERIKNAVRKSLPGKQEEVAETSDRVVEKILPHVTGALEDEPLTYADLKALLEKISAEAPQQQEITYLSGDTIVHHNGVIPLTESDMKDGLNELLARNVLRAGVIVRCPHCGIESWFHVDDVRQFNECSGCGNPRALAVDSEWRYRLNSLAKRCVSARILAVLQALASIAGRSTACFFYTPNLELYKSESEKSWRELDVACVSDGELIVGEVKDGAFSKDELMRFADAVEVIQPNRAAIFIPRGQFDKKAKTWFAELEARLAPSGVRAEVHELPTF